MRSAVLILILLAMIPLAAAVPAGTTVSLIGNNNATFSAAGFTGVGWFEYGMTPTTLVVWTSNMTLGLDTWTEIGSPLTSGKTYYVAGCDSTGCDTPVSFTMGDATPLPTTTFGYMITNATQNKFNLLMFASNLLLPFAWLFPASAFTLAISIMAALVFFALYYSLAVRTRGVAIPVMMGVLAAPYLLYTNQGLNLGIPVEFLAVAQGIFYASLAGIVLIILRK